MIWVKLWFSLLSHTAVRHSLGVVVIVTLPSLESCKVLLSACMCVYPYVSSLAHLLSSRTRAIMWADSATKSMPVILADWAAKDWLFLLVFICLWQQELNNCHYNLYCVCARLCLGGWIVPQHHKPAEQQSLQPGLTTPQPAADAAVAERRDDDAGAARRRQEEDGHQELAGAHLQQEGQDAGSQGPLHDGQPRRAHHRVRTASCCRAGQYVEPPIRVITKKNKNKAWLSPHALVNT